MVSHSVLQTTDDKDQGIHPWLRKLVISLSILMSSVVSAHATAPNITGLSVTSGPVGTSVTITGTNFGSSQGSSYVTINGAQVTTYSSWASTGQSIKVQVPVAATTSGTVVVTVPAAGSSNGVAFAVLPAIQPLSLINGPAQMGFVITGTTFGSQQGASTVELGGTPLTVIPSGWTNTQITVQVPAGATTGSVVVTVNSNGQNYASNSKSFTVTGFQAVCVN